ncbi:hypothetical protein [uncultured Clostridium sp.]|jgi:hypothetical protein|uniref:hypothetical protein n=1 Tax=uncultured Clostridium sp. TaxID=59620 RepID=UPI00261A8936|nr:hypothetical protein [uncultured Clostridium sp.]
MFKDKIIDIIHKEEDLVRHGIENLEELEILKEEALMSMSIKERAEHALDRQEARKLHDAKIAHKRDLKKEHTPKKEHLLADDVLEKFLSTNKL